MDQLDHPRVLMLGKGWFPTELGGLDRYFRELLEHLPESHGVVVGSAEDPSPRVVAVSEHSRPLPQRMLAFSRAAAKLGVRADLVDAHFALYAFLPMALGRLRKKPLVVHFQGPWAGENLAAGDRSPLRRFLRTRLECAVYARAELVITLSGAFRRLLVERYGVNPWNTAVLAPGIDLDTFRGLYPPAARARLDVSPKVFVACCARRLVPRMGVGVLLDAWQQLARQNPDARLLIAGDGELRESLQERVRASPELSGVSLLGRLSDDELICLYSAADVNVVPTLSFEGFGLIVLEAAACGTPSIVTDSGGLPEAVAGMGDELVVAAGDAAALAQRLSSAAAGELPSRARTRRWVERHAWAGVAAAHRELFQRVLRPRPQRPPRPRVVYLDHVARMSGGELSLLRLLRALRDVDAHVILSGQGPLVDRLQRDGVSVEVLPLSDRAREVRKDDIRATGLSAGALLDSVRYTLRLARRLRRLRPDLVHTYSLKAGVYGAAASRLARIPVIWHVHDRIASDYLPRLAVLGVRLLLRWLPQLVVSNSEVTRQTVRRGHGSLVIPAITEPLPPSAKTRTGQLTIGIVGRLASWKGQDVFLRAFAQAFAAGEQRGLIIGAPLFGAEEQVYALRLQELACELGIAERIEFRGHRDDIATELRALDVLVHASTIPEPFGQVIIEGMSTGLPVIAPRGGGPEEIITDGVDGVLYERGDVSALAQAMRQVANDPGLRSRLSSAAVLRARDFSADVIVPQVMEAYDRVLKR